jgi:Zn-dependent protease with chaperone function
LNALRAIPGFDEVVRKVASFFGERGVRQLFLGDAVRVTAGQRPKMNVMWTEVLETLDWADRPELYVTQTPVVNAMAVGFEHPFVVVNSGMLETLDEEELRSVLGHELGHIMSGHPTYTTIAIILMYFGISNLPFLAAAAILPFQLALLEWYRKSEFSADRAGLLTVQNLDAVMGTEMKLAGGKAYGDTLRVDEFIRQAEQYETGGDAWDTVYKILNTVMRTHPMHTVRAAELLRWHRAGGYDKILAGEYLRRGQSDSDQPLAEDFADAASYYGQKTRETMESFKESFNKARDAVSSAWRKQ